MRVLGNAQRSKRQIKHPRGRQRAFDDLGAIRVGWHTHIRNERSRAAIERLGASFEGIHRKHRVLADGSIRDTAVFAMTDDDWPEASKALRGKLR